MTDVEPPELPRGVALAWGVAAAPQRGPKREMSIEKIVEAAVALADADGLGSVSMAAVAAKLGFTPMSLYRYVSAKDDLLLLMQEEATGVPPEAHREQEGWRAQLRALFEAQALIFLRHPWILSLPVAGTQVTPNGSAWLDAALAALDGTPLDGQERLSVALAVSGHARWYGMVLAGYAEQSRTSGLSAEEVSAREAEMFDRVISADAFPHLRRAIDEGVFVAEGDPFRFALERTLDGVEQYIAELAGDGGARRIDTSWVEGEVAQVAEDRRVKEKAKAVAVAEKELRDARKVHRQAVREAVEKAQRKG